MGFVFKHKIIFLDLLLLFLYLDSFAQDWIITDNKVVEDSTILLDGNLIVKNGSSLTLNNVTLDVNCKFDGEYEIQVEPGGSMFIYNNSKISSIDLQYGFAFGVHGSAFEMKNSQLNGCGWGLEQELRDYESLISGRNGLYVNTDSAIIQGNTFSNNHVGIILADTTITLDKNNILSNTVHGIYIDNGVNCLLSDNYIEHGGNASAPIRMSPGFNNRITNNTIVSSIHRGIIEIFGSNNNIIENNNISGQGMGIMLAVSNNNIVRNNEISVDEAGIQIWGWDNRVEGNMISAAFERPSTGIYMVNAYNTIVSNNEFYDVRDENGIFLRHSSNNIIINNKVTASVSDERRPSTALLLWSKCKNNIIQNNEFSDFHRGMSLFYSCDSNIIAGNKISSIELQGFIVDGSDGNIFHSDNIFNDIGMSSFDNGENIWEYTGSVPELNPASPPKSSEIFGRTITGIEVIENQILDLGTLIIAEGAELTLRDVTLFTGRDSNKTSHIDIEPGGSLYIDNCKVIHDEYGNGFQFSPTSGSIFEMRNSELHFCGSEWWFGGLQNSSDKVVVEDNIITNTVILSSGGIWAGNTIKECYGAFLSSGSCRIINNKIHSCIRTAIISQGGEIKNNVIYDTWKTEYMYGITLTAHM